MFQEYQNNTLIMFNKSNFRDKKEYKFDDAGNIPAFEETKRELEKFKEEGSTTKWFSKEFILNLELAEMKLNKINVTSF